MKLIRVVFVLIIFSAIEITARDRVVVAMPKRNVMSSALQAIVGAMASAIIRPSLKSILPDVIVQATFQVGGVGTMKVVDGLTGLAAGLVILWFDQFTKYYFKNDNEWQLFFLDQIEEVASNATFQENSENSNLNSEGIVQIVENVLK